MTDEHFDTNGSNYVDASRPAADMAIAREVGELISHMLVDGRSVIDPMEKIWTAEAAEDLRARIGDNPRLGSSSMSSLGRAIKPRPIISICCSPPDRVPAG